MQSHKTITLAITGASGLPYTVRLLECLINAGKTVYVVMSQAASVVAALETELNLPGKIENLEAFLIDSFQAKPNQLRVFGNTQWTAPIASGSGAADAMVVCPCSSGALAAIANGISDNLLERAADVMLKERKQLILVHRETPVSEIHLENMLKLTRMGATILPASPGFYHKPQTINDLVDFVVARILDHLKVEHSLIPRWGE